MGLLSQLGLRPHELILEKFREMVANQGVYFSPYDLESVLLMLGTFRIRDELLLTLLTHQAGQLLHNFPHAHLASVLWGFARLRWGAPQVQGALLKLAVARVRSYSTS